MKLKEMSKTELKALSLTDIAYMILKENKKTLNTPNLFKKICDLLEYSEEEYTAKVGDFYTSLTTDCRFIFLDSAEWDLRDKHVVKMEVEDDEDEEATDITLEEEQDIEEEEEENLDEVIDDELDIDDEDDLEDLTIIEEDDEEED